LVSEAPPPELDFAALIADMKLAGFDGGARAGANLDFEALAGGQEEIQRRAVADPAEAQLDIARAAFKVALANLRALRQPG